MYHLYFLVLVSQLLLAQSALLPPIPGLVPSPADFIQAIEERALQVHLENQGLVDVPDRIVGGEDASISEAPFQMQMFRKHRWFPWFGPSFTCGGSLISPRTILSAAHCAGNARYTIFRYGSSSRFRSPYPDASVKRIKVHPNWDMSTVQNDIALFILNDPIKPGDNVRAVELNNQTLPGNTTLTLFGFGLTRSIGSPSERLKKAQLESLDEEECERYIGELGLKKTSGMMCSRASGKSACNGDSGGPLVVTESGQQAGIVSFGTRGCPRGSVNVYTKVSHYLDWINENVEK